MNQYIPGQAGQACGGQAIGLMPIQDQSAGRQLKALEALGARLVMTRNRMLNTISSLDSLTARVFGTVNEVAQPLVDGELRNKLEAEPAASIPLLMKVSEELDQKLNLINKAIAKLETLA